MDPRPVNLAVFRDTHGHLRLMFPLCRHCQLNHGPHLDVTLQRGDLGFYPDLGMDDKATRRFPMEGHSTRHACSAGTSAIEHFAFE